MRRREFIGAVAVVPLVNPTEKRKPKAPFRGLTMRRTTDGHAFIRLHYSADPAMTGEGAAKLRKCYTSQADWDKEQEIKA